MLLFKPIWQDRFVRTRSKAPSTRTQSCMGWVYSSAPCRNCRVARRFVYNIKFHGPSSLLQEQGLIHDSRACWNSFLWLRLVCLHNCKVIDGVLYYNFRQFEAVYLITRTHVCLTILKTIILHCLAHKFSRAFVCRENACVLILTQGGGIRQHSTWQPNEVESASTEGRLLSDHRGKTYSLLMFICDLERGRQKNSVAAAVKWLLGKQAVKCVLASCVDIADHHSPRPPRFARHSFYNPTRPILHPLLSQYFSSSTDPFFWVPTQSEIIITARSMHVCGCVCVCVRTARPSDRCFSRERIFSSWVQLSVRSSVRSSVRPRLYRVDVVSRTSTSSVHDWRGGPPLALSCVAGLADFNSSRCRARRPASGRYPAVRFTPGSSRCPPPPPKLAARRPRCGRHWLAFRSLDDTAGPDQIESNPSPGDWRTRWVEEEGPARRRLGALAGGGQEIGPRRRAGRAALGRTGRVIDAFSPSPGRVGTDSYCVCLAHIR